MKGNLDNNQRLLKQKQWAYPPQAQETDHVDIEGLKWRKGYGEDEDSVEVLIQKKLNKDSE